jgi:hypothetical protein
MFMHFCMQNMRRGQSPCGVVGFILGSAPRVEHAMQVRIDDTVLRSRFSGLLLRPGDPTYDDVRRVHNGMIDRRPALIAKCLGTPDVVDALRFGVAADLEITVRGGGHNAAGHAVCDGGLMIDLSPMKGI